MNQEVMNIFNPAQEGPTFDRIRISHAANDALVEAVVVHEVEGEVG